MQRAHYGSKRAFSWKFISSWVSRIIVLIINLRRCNNKLVLISEYFQRFKEEKWFSILYCRRRHGQPVLKCCRKLHNILKGFARWLCSFYALAACWKSHAMIVNCIHTSAHKLEWYILSVCRIVHFIVQSSNIAVEVISSLLRAHYSAFRG